MTTRSYGPLVLDVPGDFEDDSLVILRAPQPAPAVAMRVTSKPALRPSFIVKRVALGADPPPLAAIADVEERTLRQSVEGLQLHSKAEAVVGGGPAVVVEASFDSPEGRIRQVQVTRVLGRTACCFVGTALDGASFAETKTQLLALASSARLD